MCNVGEGLLTGFLIVLTFSLFVLHSQILYLTKKMDFSNRYKLYSIKYRLAYFILTFFLFVVFVCMPKMYTFKNNLYT